MLTIACIKAAFVVVAVFAHGDARVGGREVVRNESLGGLTNETREAKEAIEGAPTKSWSQRFGGFFGCAGKPTCGSLAQSQGCKDGRVTDLTRNDTQTTQENFDETCCMQSSESTTEAPTTGAPPSLVEISRNESDIANITQDVNKTAAPAKSLWMKIGGFFGCGGKHTCGSLASSHTCKDGLISLAKNDTEATSDTFDDVCCLKLGDSTTATPSVEETTTATPSVEETTTAAPSLVEISRNETESANNADDQQEANQTAPAPAKSWLKKFGGLVGCGKRTCATLAESHKCRTGYVVDGTKTETEVEHKNFDEICCVKSIMTGNDSKPEPENLAEGHRSQHHRTAPHRRPSRAARSDAHKLAPVDVREFAKFDDRSV